MRKFLSLLGVGAMLCGSVFAQTVTSGQNTTSAAPNVVAPDLNQSPWRVYIGGSDNFTRLPWKFSNGTTATSATTSGQYWGLDAGADFEAQNQWYAGVDASYGDGRLKSRNGLFPARPRFREWTGEVRGGYCWKYLSNAMVTPHLIVNYNNQRYQVKQANPHSYLKMHEWGVGAGVRFRFFVMQNFDFGFHAKALWDVSGRARFQNILGLTSAVNSKLKRSLMYEFELPITYAPWGADGWDFQLNFLYRGIKLALKQNTAQGIGTAQYRTYGAQFNVGYRF